MTARAVSEYVTGLLDGQVFVNFQAANAYCEIPPVGEAGIAPQIYVWTTDDHEMREAIPRGTGLKKVVHAVHLSLLIFMEPSATLSFRDLTEGMKKKLRAVTLPASLVDSITSDVSRLQEIGEKFDTTYRTPEATEEQRLQAYAADIVAQVVEYFQG